MLSFIFPLLGRLHPLLVHLPIGFLIFGIILVFFPLKDFKHQIPFIRLAFLLGGISAALSSASGFLQYQHEGFGWETVQFHFYFGLATTAISFWIFFYLNGKESIIPAIKYQAAGLSILLLLTGHLGGNITQGEEYLIEVLPPEIQTFLGKEISENQGLVLPEQGWENLAYFEQVVQPILNSNCKGCHNPRNSKGELDLSSWEGVQKGGENGAIFHLANWKESGLYSRLVLPLEDEDHMPPKEKRQPKKEEIELIRLWLEKGASPTLTLGQAQPELKILDPFFLTEEITFYPEIQPSLASEDSISFAKAKGFYIEPVFIGSAFLKVSCINFPEFTDADLKSLMGIRENIAYLDLGGTQGTQAILPSLAQFPNLTILKLNQLEIDGQNLETLSANSHLKWLYLNGTSIQPTQLDKLLQIPKLEKVFAFETPLSQEAITKKYPFSLETGGFQLPKIPSDTIVY